MKVDKEDVEIWRELPVTQAMFQTLKYMIQRAEREWFRDAWFGGNTSPEYRAAMHAKAEAWADVLRTDAETINELMELEYDEEHERTDPYGIQSPDPAGDSGGEDEGRDHPA